MVEHWKAFTSALPGIWKHRRWALLTTLLTGVIGAAVSVLTPGVYEATARAHVDTQSILKPLMQGMTVQPNVEQQVQMMARTLISRPNLERVMAAARLDEQHPRGMDRERILDQLEKKIILKPAGGTNFYSIEYRHASQEAALKVVESLLSIFVESTKTNQVRDTQQALKFVDDQIAHSKKKLEATENALKEFKIANIDVMPNLAQDYVARSAEAQRELQQSKLELRQAVNARNALQRRLTGVPQTYTTGESPSLLIPRVPSETEVRLQAAQSRLDDYLTRYTDAHPDVLNARRVVGDLEKQLERERAGLDRTGVRRSVASETPNRLYQELSVTLADAEARVASLGARVAEAETQMARTRQLSKTIPQVEAEYIQLNRDYASNKANYEQLLTRRASAEMAGDMEENSAAREFRVVDPPRVSPKTVWPNRPLLLLLTFCGSLTAGVAAAFFLDRKAPAFFDRLSLQSAIDLPVLGSVSLVPSQSRRSRQVRSVVGYSAAMVAYSFVFAAGIGYFAFGHLLPPQATRTTAAQVSPGN